MEMRGNKYSQEDDYGRVTCIQYLSTLDELVIGTKRSFVLVFDMVSKKPS